MEEDYTVIDNSDNLTQIHNNTLTENVEKINTIVLNSDDEKDYTLSCISDDSSSIHRTSFVNIIETNNLKLENEQTTTIGLDNVILNNNFMDNNRLRNIDDITLSNIDLIKKQFNGPSSLMIFGQNLDINRSIVQKLFQIKTIKNNLFINRIFGDFELKFYDNKFNINETDIDYNVSLLFIDINKNNKHYLNKLETFFGKTVFQKMILVFMNNNSILKTDLDVGIYSTNESSVLERFKLIQKQNYYAFITKKINFYSEFIDTYNIVYYYIDNNKTITNLFELITNNPNYYMNIQMNRIYCLKTICLYSQRNTLIKLSIQPRNKFMFYYKNLVKFNNQDYIQTCIE
jgi:hypothetical protein